MKRTGLKVKNDNTPYIIYHPSPCYNLPPINRNDIPSEGIQTMSIDIGIKNFAIRIEKRYATGLISPVFFNTIDFTKLGVNTNETSGTTGMDPKILDAATVFIIENFQYMANCRIIGIERQMAINYKSTRMFQHILTMLTFMAKRGEFIYKDLIIFDIDPKLKGQMLKFPRGLTYAELKKESIDKAIELLTWRNDEWSLKVIESNRGKAKLKADDLADTIVQMEAWFVHNNGMVTQPPAIKSLLSSLSENIMGETNSIPFFQIKSDNNVYQIAPLGNILDLSQPGASDPIVYQLRR